MNIYIYIYIYIYINYIILYNYFSLQLYRVYEIFEQTSRTYSSRENKEKVYINP